MSSRRITCLYPTPLKKSLLFFGFYLFFFTLFSQQVKPPEDKEKNGLVNWVSLQEAERLVKIQPKPVLIDMYTDWCGWCKHMMKTTYSNPELASYINAYFYPVKFNAETVDTVFFQGKTYINTGTGKRSPHQLALELMNKQMSYPTTLFMHNQFQFKIMVPGYLDEKKIEPLLIYMNENIFNTTVYQDFQKYFDQAFGNKPKTDSVAVKWFTMQEAIELTKKNPKKIFVNIYTDWCNGCKVMNEATYKHPVIAQYMNEHFYPVNLNAQTRDTITYLGNIYTYQGIENNPFHSFVIAALNGKVILPSAVFINHDLQLITTVPFFMTPEACEPVLHFFGEDVFKTAKWEDYKKSFVGTVKK